MDRLTKWLPVAPRGVVGGMVLVVVYVAAVLVQGILSQQITFIITHDTATGQSTFVRPTHGFFFFRVPP